MLAQPRFATLGLSYRQEARMFAPYCATCRRRVLLGTRRLTRVHRPPDGRTVVTLRCFCGRVVADEIRAAGARPI
ncbi:MAG: hypothetical protein H0V33_01380 [Acidimicrobiia bacterium]|nr:hypothetical protein [Acidimicrobiia bacterium]